MGTRRGPADDAVSKGLECRSFLLTGFRIINYFEALVESCQLGELSIEILGNGDIIFSRDETPKAFVTMRPFEIQALELYD